MYSPTIQKLIKLFAKFPTVGPKAAARFVFYLTSQPEEEINELVGAIKELQESIKICSLCGKSFQDEGELCKICTDLRRDKTILCIVEKEIDLEAMEKTHSFKGLYFILGKSTLKLAGEDKTILEEKVETLTQRIQKNGIVEIILALNPTTEGQNTALWLKRQLTSCNIKTTQLGRGLPIGGELEYADEETLSSALSNRQ